MPHALLPFLLFLFSPVPISSTPALPSTTSTHFAPASSSSSPTTLPISIPIALCIRALFVATSRCILTMFVAASCCTLAIFDTASAAHSCPPKAGATLRQLPFLQQRQQWFSLTTPLKRALPPRRANRPRRLQPRPITSRHELSLRLDERVQVASCRGGR